MSGLKEIAPEPVTFTPGIPTSLPSSGNSHPYLTRSISILGNIQYYSVIPFSLFSCIHVGSVVVGPAIFGPEAGNDLIGLGRELYQVPVIELGILASVCTHVLSGISLNFLKKYYRYVKYGKSKEDKKRNEAKLKLEKSMKISSNPANDEVSDINEGLGGITSIIGIGSRKSITYKYLGLSPLSFSGYIFLILLSGHVFMERISPILVDGDSSMIDLSYVAYAAQENFPKIMTAMNLLVITGSYHIMVGWNRYLKQFSLKTRKRTYYTIGALAVLTCVSVLRISRLEVFRAAAVKFASYAGNV